MQKAMTFLVARGTLIENDWLPVPAPEKPSEHPYSELESQFLAGNIFEVESCKDDTCIMNYRKEKNCLYLTIKGSRISSMTVTNQKMECRNLNPSFLQRSWNDIKSLFVKT